MDSRVGATLLYEMQYILGITIIITLQLHIGLQLLLGVTTTMEELVIYHSHSLQ